MKKERYRSARRRSTAANLLAEMPAGLYLLFVGIGIPMLVLGSMFVRAFFLYQATADSCKAAARCASFTAAQTKVNSVFTTCVNAWPGISGTPTFSVLVKPLAVGGATDVKTAPLAAGSVQISQNVYMARVVVDGQIEPLVRIEGTWLGMSIPGLTTAYPLTSCYVSYFENPSGLTQ